MSESAGVLRSILALIALITVPVAVAGPCDSAFQVTLSQQDFQTDEFRSCSALDGITLGGNANLSAGSEVVLNAPEVALVPPVSVASGGILHIPDYVCGGVFTFEAGKNPDLEIHVATDGIDTPGCGPVNSPCAQIDYAASLAVPGTAIVVHAGTYAGGQYIDNLAGSLQQPIWIGGAEGEERPIIDGGNEGLHLSNVRYLIIHDLVVRDAAFNGINADDGGNYSDVNASRFLIFRGLQIQNIGGTGNQDCLKLSGIDDFWVLDSEFSFCGGGLSGSGIDQVGCHNGVILGNHFHDTSGNAVQCKGGSENIEIRANRIENPGARGINMGGSTGFAFFRPPLSPDSPNAEARDIRVIGNLFRGGDAPVAFVGCVDCVVANNTIDTPRRWVFRILQETVSTLDYEFLPAQQGRFINNIVNFDSQVVTAVNVGPNTAPETFEIRNGLWYRYDNPSQSNPPGGLPVTEIAPIVGSDPQFNDVVSGDFSIPATSPAFMSGAAIPQISADMVDLCYRSSPSRGAYEVQ